VSEQKVSIDGQQYNLSDLSEGARNQLANIQIVDQEIARLQRQIQISQAAKGSFVAVLKVEMGAEPEQPFEGQSFKF